MTTIIGIDFDNTLASYDAVIFGAARDRGLIRADAQPTKRAIRDRIRSLPDGEIEWQKLQALVYGPLMSQARLVEGVSEFIRASRARNVRIHVVSHKTEYAGYDTTGTNLRAAALEWMTANGLVGADSVGLSRQDVYFEETRGAKIARLAALRCTHFIDDLEEVFLDATFPADVEKLLYVPDAEAASDLSGDSFPGNSFPDDIKVMRGWKAISDYFFGH